MIKYQIYNYSQANNIASLVFPIKGFNSHRRREQT